MATINGSNTKNDKLTGTNTADTLNGLAGNDTLNGGAGNDRLNGGAGNDSMSGGAGNDTYLVDAQSDRIKETAGGGTDTVLASVTFSLAAAQYANIENLTLTGAGNTTGTGNEKANVITGNSGHNRLIGNGGADRLVGGSGTGKDTLDGGAGNDTLSGAGGNDSLVGGTGTGVDSLSGGDDNDTLSGGGGADRLLGGAGNDILLWDASDVRLDGGTDNDILRITGNVAVDLTDETGPVLAGIEVVKLAGANTLMLDAAAVIGVSGTDTLRIEGEAGDRVMSDEDWVSGGSIEIGGNDYDVWTSGDATLHIADGIALGEAPVGTVPGAQDAVLMQDLVIDGISVNDVDLGANTVTINLSTDLGSLSLGQLDGLTFTAGDGDEDLEMSFTGSLADVNAALANLVLHATELGAGAITLESVEEDATTDTDMIAISVATVEVSALDGAHGFRIAGEAEGDRSGYSVSVAGDLNDDGFDDVIIAADRADPNGSQTGAAYVVYGQASGFASSMDLTSLDGTNGFKISGETAFGFAGSSVSAAGDVNGDGREDLIVGAQNDSYVLLQPATGFSSLDLSSLNGSNGFQIAGESGFARSVSAGDLNGDGYSDVIIGAYQSDTNGADSGAVYVVFGQDSFSSGLHLSSLDGTTGFKIPGEAAGDKTGSAVSAGDLNGDGLDDLIIGAEWADPHGSTSGATYVLFGQATGFAANVPLSGLNGTNGFRLSGESTQDYAGYSVSAAGDVNGDGFGDLIVGALRADVASAYAGAAYVVFGKSSGFLSNLDLSALDGTSGFRMSGQEFADGTGVSVSGAGDVNGDGFDDLIVGERLDTHGNNSGGAHVVFGKSSFSANLHLRGLDTTDGFLILGEGTYDLAGMAVSGGGDVNGDGFDDIIVGAPYNTPNSTSSGSSYVIFGGNFSGAASVLGGSGDDGLDGTSSADVMIGGLGNDTLAGGGGLDVFRGGAGDDVFIVSNFADLDGGTGADTIVLDGEGTFTVSAFRGRISGIEAIDLGDGGVTVGLSLNDVLALSDTSNTLTLDGPADGDTDAEVVVTGDDSWGMTQDEDYEVYTLGAATLRVHVDVDIQINAIS